MIETIYDWGINDADYAVSGHQLIDGQLVKIECPFYSCWVNMVARSKSQNFKDIDYWYEGVDASEEWKYFTKFKAWMEKQDWKGKELDKDILVEGNKLYSPKTCAFVTHATNNFFNLRPAARGEYPTGVSFIKDGNYFIARCQVIGGKRKTIGTYGCMHKAHLAWAYEKQKQGLILAEQQSDSRVGKAIRERCQRIVDNAREILKTVGNVEDMKPIWNFENSDAGNFIQRVRKDVLGISQTEASVFIAGCKQSNFARYEAGITSPPRSLILLMSLLEKTPSLYEELKNSKPFGVGGGYHRIVGNITEVTKENLKEKVA